MPVEVVFDKSTAVMKAIREISYLDVLIGVPEAKAKRENTPINNAALAYIHEYGNSARHIPPRPFLRPTIAAMKAEIIAAMLKVAREACDGKHQQALRTMSSLGIKASTEVKKRISAKIPPPLAPSTVVARLRRTKRGQGRLRRMGRDPQVLAQWGAANLTPLVDTGKLRNSITYVVRDRRPKQ